MHCCISQADMRLLLQPEELQKQQLVLLAAERASKLEDDEAVEMPTSYEAYLKAEALRAAHSAGLFKLCPECGMLWIFRVLCEV